MTIRDLIDAIPFVVIALVILSDYWAKPSYFNAGFRQPWDL